MRVGIVIPWRGGCPHRATAYKYVRRRLLEMLPYDVTVYAADSGHPTFRRAASRNLGVRQALASGADVVVVCDADTVPSPLPLTQAVEGAATDGRLHLPYTRYVALTQRGTRRYQRGADLAACQTELDWEASTGGVLVITPQRWFHAGGMDERFVSWGYEDTSFRIACDALLGPTVRHSGTIVHCWHPSTQDRGTPQKSAGLQLALRYDAAEGIPEAVLALVQEAGGYPGPENSGDTP